MLFKEIFNSETLWKNKDEKKVFIQRLNNSLDDIEHEIEENVFGFEVYIYFLPKVSINEWKNDTLNGFSIIFKIDETGIFSMNWVEYSYKTKEGKRKHVRLPKEIFSNAKYNNLKTLDSIVEYIKYCYKKYRDKIRGI